jgi:archaellum component FlaC
MLISEMEAVLRSLDQRVGRIEQILPTLATKTELRDEIRGVKVLIEDLRDDVKLVHERIDVEMAGLNRHLDERFGAVDAKLGSVDGKFATVDARFATVDGRFDKVDDRFDKVDDRFDKVDDRFDKVDDRFDQMLAQFAEVFRRLDRIERR